MKWGRKLIVGSLLAGALVGWQTVASAEEAADITYGYHPYWTGGWSGVIIKPRPALLTVEARGLGLHPIE